MKEFSEKGFAQLLVILLLVAGIGAGTYLVQKSQTLTPHAAELKKNIFLSGSPNSSEKKIPNPQPISSETASAKVINLGYALLDSYINSLMTPIGQFTNGTLDFKLDNGTNVHIAPTSINGKIWRSITFRYKNTTARAIILDGPVSGQPGTPNQPALTDAKNVLKEELDKSRMIAFSVNKDPSKVVKFNLSSEYDVQAFTKLMQSSIVTKPLSTEQPTTSSQGDITLYCQVDSDCSCGINTSAQQCAVGNTKYIDTTRQCSDFCTGIAGNLITKCVSNKCTQISKR